MTPCMCPTRQPDRLVIVAMPGGSYEMAARCETCRGEITRNTLQRWERQADAA